MNASQQSQAGKRSVGALVGGLIALGLGLALAWFGSREAMNELLLRSNHRTVDASVVDARTVQGRKMGRSYEIQYRFNVPDSSETYSRRDETGRAGLWTSLADEETWREAQRARRVRIIYRPDDPWVNRPEQAGAMPFGDTLAVSQCDNASSFASNGLIPRRERDNALDRTFWTARTASDPGARLTRH